MPGSLIQLETQGIETQLHINPTTARHVRLQELPPGFTDSIHIVTHGHAAAYSIESPSGIYVERFEFPKSWTLLTYPYGHNIIIGSPGITGY